VRDASNTVLQSNPMPVESGGERTVSRPSSLPVARRPLGPGVVNLGGQDPTTARRDDGNNVSQAGQVFADLLLVASTASRCPLALVSVVKGGSWSTLSFGAEREPVEVTDPASNPALAHSRLARSNLGIRWLLGVPLLGPTGEVTAIFAVLDTEPRELSRRERAAMVAIGRLISGALSAHRGVDQLAGPASPAEHPNGLKQTADGHTLLRSHEVAALFDVTERTVINWAASGKLACLRTVGGHLRFRSEDVMSLLEANSLRRPQGL
jgi:excisionase family DNA binding protein